MLRVAVVTCYFDPDYVRARTIRAGLGAIPSVEMIVVKTQQRGWLRYPEMLVRLIGLRWREKPDAYLVTFRGQEILPLVLALAGRTRHL